MQRILAALILGAAAAACGSDQRAEPIPQAPTTGTSDENASELESNETEPSTAFPDGPPPLEVSQADARHSLDAFSYCWTIDDEGICADGEPAKPLPSLGGDEPLTLDFAIDGWHFVASMLDPCDPSTVVVERSDAGWLVDVAGPVGTTDLMLFGRGPEGDAAYAVETVRQVETAPATMRGWLSPFNLPGHDETFDLWLGLDGPDELLDIERASLTVAGADGGTFEIDLEPNDAGECFASFRIPASIADDVDAAIGGLRWTYGIELALADGSVFEGTASFDPTDPDSAFIEDGLAVRFAPADTAADG